MVIWDLHVHTAIFKIKCLSMKKKREKYLKNLNVKDKCILGWIKSGPEVKRNRLSKRKS